MKLYLIQHGKSVSKDVDPDCPLSEEGQRDVAALAEFLKNANISIDQMLHSSKTRAKQTAEILAAAFGGTPVVKQIEGIKPMEPIEPIIEMLKGEQQNIALVGHLPFMGKMVSALLTGQEEPAVIAYQPGSICCLERNDEGRWSLNWMIRPDCFSVD